MKQSRRQLSAGIGLAATGGVISVVGVGVSLPFAAAPRNAIDNPAWPEAVHEAGELERNRFKMKTPYYSAWVTGAVGGAILLSGVALIVTTIVVKNKKAASSTSARLRPGLGGLEVQF